MTLSEMWRNCIRLTDRRPIPDWAAEFVTLFPPLTRAFGKFDVSSSRHFVLPFAWLQSNEVAEVNILAPVRSGKTLIGDVWIDWVIVNDPGPVRIVMQDDQVAKEHAETRTMKQLKAIPGVEFLLPTDRHKDRGQEIIFPTGYPFYIQGPALNKLQSKGFRFVWVDEPWLPNVQKNFGEIKGRLGDYERMKISKLLCTGQGGAPGDAWDVQASSGEMNEWHVTCPKCGAYMAGAFHKERSDGSRWGITWDEVKDANGFYDVDACLNTVRFECEKCGHAQFDTGRTKADWNDTGKYVVVGAENKSRKTAHWTFAIDYPWALAVEQWLRARNTFQNTRDLKPTIIFMQKRLAEHADERTVQGAEQSFRREEYNAKEKDPNEVLRLITIDCQSESLFYVLVRSWIVKGPQVETRRLWWGKCYSFDEIESKRKEWGCSIPLIDSGFRAKGPNGVYAACARFGWWALKGADGSAASFLHLVKGRRVMRSYAPKTQGDSGTRAGFCRLYRFSASSMADIVKGMIDAGTWIEPRIDETDATEIEYKRGMKSEACVPVKNRYGRVEMKWITLDDCNHAWDCSKMQVFGAVFAKILPDPFEEPAKAPQTQKEIDAQQEAVDAARHRGTDRGQR